MNLFVAKLSYDTQEDELRAAFEQFGQVESVKIVFDRIENRSKGFGFVEMASDADGQAAIDGLDGTEIDGRTIVVKKAEPKPEGGGRGGFNRGGGGGGGGFNRGGGGGGGFNRGGSGGGGGYNRGGGGGGGDRYDRGGSGGGDRYSRGGGGGGGDRYERGGSKDWGTGGDDRY